jgi:Rap guanine nucleotide exchange factor 1
MCKDFKRIFENNNLEICFSELFQKIELPEVLLWAKEQSEELSPNLSKFTEHFNNMSYWARSILLTQPEAEDRKKFMQRFIKIMKVSHLVCCNHRRMAWGIQENRRQPQPLKWL